MTRSRLDLVKGYYLACALTPLEGLIAPVVVLYYVDHLGFGFATYSAFISAILLLNLVFEAPLGYLSDRIGRRRAMLAGHVIYAGALAATLAVGSHAHLFAVAVALSFGQSLSSGNLQSIAYETFARAGEKERFGRFLAQNTALAVSVTAVAALAGGLLADFWLALPMIADVALLACRLIIGVAVFFVFWGEPDRRPEPERRAGALSVLANFRGANLRGANLRGVADILRKPAFWAAAAAGAICFAVLRASLNFYQPVLAERDWSGSQIGLLFSLSIAASALLSHRLLKTVRADFDSGQIATLLAVALLVSGLGFALGDDMIGFFLAGFVMHQITRITVPSFATGAEQSAIPEGYPHRTTAVSLSLTLKAVVASLAVGASGLFVGLVDLGVTLAALNFAGAAAAAAIVFAYRRQPATTSSKMKP